MDEFDTAPMMIITMLFWGAAWYTLHTGKAYQTAWVAERKTSPVFYWTIFAMLVVGGILSTLGLLWSVSARVGLIDVPSP